MAYTFTEKKRIRKSFSSRSGSEKVPNLLEIQKASYRKLLQANVEPLQRIDEGLIEKIVNRSFRRLTREGTTEALIESEDHFGDLLCGTFGLTVPDEDRSAIWRSILSREERRAAGS